MGGPAPLGSVTSGLRFNFSFLESKAAKRGGRLEAGSGREACGAGPLLSAIFPGESEPAEARALFRTQTDRPCRLGCKTSALRIFFILA